MSCDVRSCDVPCNGHVVCSKWFCDNVVIQSTILYYKVLLCTTKYCSSTTLYYKVLLQYCSVLHSTKTYYSSATLYYKVLLQYYSVLQSTTPVLLCTTKYYSSTTLYCKVLLQYTLKTIISPVNPLNPFFKAWLVIRCWMMITHEN